MKKIFRFLLLFPLCLILTATPVFAETEEDLRAFSDSQSIMEHLPEEIKKQEVTSLLEEENPADTFNQILQKILSLFSLGLQDCLSLFLSLLLLLLISSLFESVKKSFNPHLNTAFDFLFLTAAAFICYQSLTFTVQVVTESIFAANTFILSTVPVSTVLLTLSGSPGAASVQSAHLSFVIAFISTLLSRFLLPLVKVLFCFSFVDGLGEKNLGGISSFLQKGAKRLCIFFFSLVSAMLALKNALASSADSVAMRSVRFAAGNFIPVVGSLVGENTKVLAGAFQTVKTECGVICLVVLLYLLLRPILVIWVEKICLSLAAATGQILGENRLGRLLTSMGHILDLMNALVISHGIYLVFVITLFLKAKGNL